MKGRVFLVLGMFLSLVFLLRCSEEREDDCEGNAPPELLGLHLVIDGNELFAGYTPIPGDQVSFFLDYQDEDCNLNGGQLFVDWLGSGLEPIGRISIDDPCDGLYPSHPFSFLKTLQEAGSFAFVVRITDTCGDPSNRISGTLEVSHAPRILSAQFSPGSIAAGDSSSLQIRACDEDNDLNGGEVLVYKHGNPAPLLEPIPWSHMGAGPGIDVSDCETPRTFVVNLRPLHSVCVDLHGTDAMQHGSGRFSGKEGQGVCIQVINP